MCGLLLAVRPAAGVAFALALVFVPVALLHLPRGLALWAPIPFVQFLPALWIGPTVASCFVLGAWMGVDRQEASIRLRQLGQMSGALVGVGLLLLWFSLSLIWSDGPLGSSAGLLNWFIAALVLVIFASVVRAERDVRLIVAAFVGGAVVSVAIGLIAIGYQPVSSAYESSTFTEGRLQGGSGDPNYLAAGLVPALTLAAGLAITSRSVLARIALVAGSAVIATGLAATQSRGGLVAAIVAATAALLVMRRHRAQIFASLVVVGAIVAFWFVNNPQAWERVVSSDGGGSGRTELWSLALRMTQDHPFLGVGFGNFDTEVIHYVREPGQLESVELVLSRSQVVHNAYLQALCETGVIGLALLVLVLGTLLRLTYRAGTRFDRRGEQRMATIARAVFVAQLSGLTALAFISFGADQRLWLLFGLGAALYARSGMGAERPPALPAG
ncbi:MAG: O-antigen ligase family protein [Candidatus Limnocylindria bacterium]